MNKKETHILSDVEFEVWAKPNLLSLCKDTNPDPTGQPFIERKLERAILFKYTTPHSNLLEGIKLACANLGEDGFYYSVRGYFPGRETDFPYHRYVLFKDYDDFEQKIYIVDHTIYSVNGRWAIIGCDEFFGLLTCEASFLETLKAFVPDLEDQVKSFLDYYGSIKARNGMGHIEWLPGLLKHMYGEEDGTKKILLLETAK